jgi:hypothetical protein
MQNKKNRILVAFFLALVVQVSCNQAYPTSMPTPILADVPKLLVRGEKHRFSVKTNPGAECHAAIGYNNLKDKWIWMELSTIEANQNGICEWTWEIPEDAQDGIGELRAYIEEAEQSTNVFPANFCIGSCP